MITHAFGARVRGVALVATSANPVVPHFGVLWNAVVHRVAGQVVRLLLPLIQQTHRLPFQRLVVRALTVWLLDLIAPHRTA